MDRLQLEHQMYVIGHAAYPQGDTSFALHDPAHIAIQIFVHLSGNQGFPVFCAENDMEQEIC